MSRLPISLAPLFLALPALPVQAQSRWTLFEARFDHAVASDTNLAVGFGGRLDSNSQDGVGDFWSTVSLPWTPQPNSGSTDGRYLHGLAAISSGVFVSFGGYQTRPGQQRTLPPETGVVAPPGEILFGTPTVTPRPRFGHAMVRDTLNNRVILFGGDLGGAQSNETWEYTRNNGGLGNWNNITDASAPPGRSLHCMAYDEVRGRILMFGGTGGIADTWEFNCANNQWTQLATPAPLQARTSAAMQYSVTGHFVLFGGLGSNSQPLADTWTWRASTGWTLEVNATGPTARSSQAMTWTGASSQRQVVMVGGRDGNGVITAESWIWTGTNWARPNAPESRYFGAMAHDASRNVMVLFGGARNSDDTPLGDTWELSASGWRRWPTETCTDPRPSARLSHGLTFVGNTNQVLLFGGANASGQRQLDTWLFNGSPCNGWSPQPNPPPPQSPYPTSDMAMAYDSARGEVVVFGGISDTLGIHNQTWTWVFTRSPSQWAQPPSNGTPPPARARGLMAYDGVRRKMVLFGGRLILTHNELLYPYHKWFLRVLADAKDKPSELLTCIENLYQMPSAENTQLFYDLIKDFREWPVSEKSWPAQFMLDSELNWQTGATPVDDL